MHHDVSVPWSPPKPSTMANVQVPFGTVYNAAQFVVVGANPVGPAGGAAAKEASALNVPVYGLAAEPIDVVPAELILVFTNPVDGPAPVEDR